MMQLNQLLPLDILLQFVFALISGKIQLHYCSEVNITVSNAPKIVDPVERLNHPEGTNATFTCSIGSGELTGLSYEWRKDENLVLPTSKKVRITVLPENYQSILRVIDLKASDAGVYSCLAKNKYGQDRVSTRLNVKVQLKWTVQPTDVEIAAGKPLSVPCLADGLPKPSINWVRLSSITNNEPPEVLGQELRFASVRQQDDGLYECQAKNGVDKDLVARIKLTVLGK